MKRHCCWITVVIILTTAVMSPHADAGITPKMPTTEKIGIIETEHFNILYQAPLARTAPAIAVYCEEAYAALTRLLDGIPSETITVYIIDNYDTHNGWATAVPHNTMAIYISGNRQVSALYQPANYLRRTVYHELMHVLSLDMRSGYNKTLEKIFGKPDPTATGGDPASFAMFLVTASPNLLAPNWYLEGTAMYAETEFAGPGRGRSTMADMIFRTAVRDDNLIPYSQWYLETPRWPYGSSAYWYGMRFVQYLSETSENPNPVGSAIHSVSKAFLFNFNGGIQRVTRQHWKIMAEAMLAHERHQQTANLQTLARQPFTPVQRLTPQTMTVYNTRVVGDLIFLMAATEEKRNALHLFDPQTGTLQKIHNAQTPMPFGALSGTADGRYLFYTDIQMTNHENYWYEVRQYDTRTGKDVLVTPKGRYRYVDISPDGRYLAAVSQRQGRTYLVEVPFASAGDPSQEKIIKVTGLETDLAGPRYSPGGDQIVFVEADGQGFRLNRYHRSSGHIEPLWRTTSQIIAPTWHPQGKEILFSSDQNGVYNLYRLALTGSSQPKPVTHVWGGLFYPSFSKDGRTLAAVHYDGFGPHLVQLPYLPDAMADKPLPVVRPRWTGGKAAAFKREAPSQQVSTTHPAASRNYNSLASIRPDYWTPWATFSTYGIQGGVVAAFSDPAQHQELLLMAGKESEYDSPLARISYTYRGLKPDITLYAGVAQSVYPDLLAATDTTVDYDYAEETQWMGFEVSFPLWERMERRLTFKVGYEFLQRDAIEAVETDYADVDLALAPTQDDQGSVWGRVDYASTTDFNRSVSVEDGALISLGAAYSNPCVGGEIDAGRVLLDINLYQTMPFFKNHVLKIYSSYGAGWGDDYAQGLFGIGGSSVQPAAASTGITRTLGLRGYDTNFQTGQCIVRVGAAYRFPLWNIYKGVESAFPLYNRSLFLELFYEGGRTYDDADNGDDIGWLTAVGAEVNYGLTIFRFLQFAPGLGMVYAPQRDDNDPTKSETVSYLTLKLWASF